MNQRIEQLTRNYLNSLSLSYSLNNGKKQRIIEINSQTEWIIFNASSLKSRRLDYYNSYRSLLGANGGYSSETYDITSPALFDIFKEVVKIYGNDDLDRNNIEIKLLQFVGGGGNFERAGQVVKKFAVPLSNQANGKGDDYYWVAINKKVSGEDFETIFMDGDLCFNDDRRHWKTENSLNNLLNDNNIANSRERERERTETPPPNNLSAEDNSFNNNQSTPPSFPTTQSIQFVLREVDRPFPDYNLFYLIPNSLVVNGSTITRIITDSSRVNNLFQSGDLQAGNVIAIADIQFESGRASIDNGNELWISNHFANIRVITNETHTHSTHFEPPPNIPPIFPEVQQKNQQLAQEENNLALLVAELLEVIEKNKEIVQEGQQLGLNLPELSQNALDYFQEEFFDQLDEAQPLNSSHNQQINTDNEEIKQKKLNIKKNIYGVYDSNKKRLNQEKTNPNVPKSELEKLKQEVKEKINKVLTDKDNLRNINLTTLANGKYQNWEKDIDQITASGQLTTYVETFLEALQEVGAKEKEKEQEKESILPKNDSPLKENDVIDNNTEKVINSLPLEAAKSVAKKKIRELFNKYKPSLEKLKKLWGGEKSWMNYLEKCNSPEEIMTFLKKLEQELIRQNLSQQKGNDKDKKPPTNYWILLPIMVGLIILVSLVIIIKLRYKRKKVK